MITFFFCNSKNWVIFSATGVINRFLFYCMFRTCESRWSFSPNIFKEIATRSWGVIKLILNLFSFISKCATLFFFLDFYPFFMDCILTRWRFISRILINNIRNAFLNSKTHTCLPRPSHIWILIWHKSLCWLNFFIYCLFKWFIFFIGQRITSFNYFFRKFVFNKASNFVI